MDGEIAATQLSEAEGAPLSGHPLSLRSLLADAARLQAKVPAVISMHQASDLLPATGYPSLRQQDCLTWTYEQLDEASHRLATSLYRHGIRKGMQSVVCLHNSIEWALWFWTCAKLGTAFVPLDPKSISRKPEISHYLNTVQPDMLVVTDRTDVNTIQEYSDVALPNIKLKVVVEGVLDGESTSGWVSCNGLLLDSHSPDKIETSSIEGVEDLESDVVLIVFTSGTSGLPKACPHTNRSLWATCTAGVQRRPLEPSYRLAHHLPPAHMLAVIELITFWTAGATVVYPSRAFDAESTLDAIEIHKCSHMSGGAPCGTVISSEIAEAVSTKLGATTLVAYGMTEGAPVMSIFPEKKLSFEDGCINVGNLTNGTKIKICEPGKRKILRRGEVGELHYSGDLLIRGYLNGDNTPFYSDEKRLWINSGDEAKMSYEGAIYILGRYKVVIIRAGKNLSPALIEICLNKAGVIAQVIGVPDEIADELPLAVIQPLKPGPFPIEAMQALVTKALGAGHVPTAYLTLRDLGMETFPTTTSGKISKDELRHVVMTYLEAQNRFPEEETPNRNSLTYSWLGLIEQALVDILSRLLGQPKESLPLDKPIHELADSINIPRFQAYIKRKLKKDISTKEIYCSESVQALAQTLNDSKSTNQSSRRDVPRRGPPTAHDMVHTGGDEALTSRTRESVSLAVERIGLTWDDVEDVFPMIAVNADYFP
ncbi:uncharacterized protein KY384_007203 [Bacidia gigantensis]|uniref:uncharacterized protein n=1 Tax=Bacidia gigantensis TaxID=2732470 RepID=UPI001D043BF6|nr:uncharacterized protein KY384_007203 [Bacidia gigantensis]KAG8528286.1 hypothetical protein KY384_007203 [Bacidia gigantensis]